jgi:ubiquinol-cytochrome c reductase cytochrome b subunit
MSRVGDWLDERIGHRRLAQVLMAYPVAGGASWGYVFGATLLAMLTLQVVTGIALAFYYSPSPAGAWASVAYLQDQVTWGWLVRGLHGHGASALVVLLGAHLVQTALAGAYKRPREVTWWLGIGLLGLMLGEALTGYLLPWDQKGYWATHIVTGIAGQTPFLGAQAQQALQGGNDYGALTLSRFFALHVFVLPLGLLLLVVGHVALVRKHGVTVSKKRQARTAQPFWPDQVVRDLVAVALAVIALFVVTVATHGVELSAPADPAGGFDARPEWYFLPLFQVLKYFSGPVETVVALGAPVVVVGVLVAMPLVDRKDTRASRARALLPLGLLGVIGGVLAMLAVAEDRGDVQLAERTADAEAQALRARELAVEHGVPAAGGLAIWDLDPERRAAYLWRTHCVVCHEGAERKAPIIGKGFGSRAWLRGLLEDPDGPAYFGKVEKVQAFDDRMKPTKLEGAELDAVVEWLYSERGPEAQVDRALVERGRALFDEGTCSDCHERDGKSESSPGPNLGGLNSRAGLADFIAHPGAPHHFGELDDMPEFADKLNAKDLQLLADWIHGLAEPRDR